MLTRKEVVVSFPFDEFVAVIVIPPKFPAVVETLFDVNCAKEILWPKRANKIIWKDFDGVRFPSISSFNIDFRYAVK